MEILAKEAFTQKENIFLAERQIRTANLSEHRACTTHLSPIKGPDKIHKRGRTKSINHLQTWDFLFILYKVKS